MVTGIRKVKRVEIVKIGTVINTCSRDSFSTTFAMVGEGN